MISKDPVQVYCRLRPMQSPTDVPCMRVTSDTTVVHMPPGSADNFRTMTNEEEQTTFNHVFTSDVTQREIFETVALPLVENLICGRNGLLFTYGVTGSGKTYTITGKRQDAGIMPRCLDAIFNTIANNRSKKFVSEPDKLNSFDVQNEIHAMVGGQHVLHAGLFQRTGRLGKLGKIDSDGDSNPMIVYERNESQSVAIEPDNVYAVFVTYVEIYYSSVYDLLDEDDITPNYEIAMEDGDKNMYEHTFTEVEVKTAEEAFELFQRGQRKRRVAHTARTNAESSGSHGVFTIRLVQTPLDCENEHVKQDKRIVCVSQLSLVDFAGFESIGKDFHQIWAEAGNILASVSTLRSYLGILREDQDTDEMDSHKAFEFSRFFQRLFDWQGQVRMILCVNPRADDYDNTKRGMKITEMARGVYIARDNSVKLDVGFTPGRRQANKEARSKLEKEGRPEAADLDIDFGRSVMAIEQENVNLKAPNTQQKRKISALKGHLREMETQMVNLLRKFNETACSLEQEMRNRDLALNQCLIDKQRIKQKYNTKMQVETDKMNRELEIKQRKHFQEIIFNNQFKEIEDKLRLVKQILVGDNGINLVIVPSKEQVLTTRVISPDRDSRISRKDRTPVSNPRYRRSQSADGWIDHRPQTLVPIGTVLQPLMQKRRIVTRLTSSKEITQDHGTDGGVETKLYKGDILPTSDGGSQVVFNDMECLKPSSPKRRKLTGSREEGEM